MGLGDQAFKETVEGVRTSGEKGGERGWEASRLNNVPPTGEN